MWEIIYSDFPDYIVIIVWDIDIWVELFLAYKSHYAHFGI